MKEPALWYLLVGLPGSGKTTKAKQLEVEASALRLTLDEWMIPLFGRNAQAERDVLEGRLIWIALRALQLYTNVILDFGFWSKDERSSLRWFARQIGAKSQVIYLPIDLETQRKRIQNRFAETPDQTWPMSEEELTKWRAFFQEPDEAELMAPSWKMPLKDMRPGLLGRPRAGNRCPMHMPEHVEGSEESLRSMYRGPHISCPMRTGQWQITRRKQ